MQKEPQVNKYLLLGCWVTEHIPQRAPVVFYVSCTKSQIDKAKKAMEMYDIKDITTHTLPLTGACAWALSGARAWAERHYGLSDFDLSPFPIDYEELVQ